MLKGIGQRSAGVVTRSQRRWSVVADTARRAARSNSSARSTLHVANRHLRMSNAQAARRGLATIDVPEDRQRRELEEAIGDIQRAQLAEEDARHRSAARKAGDYETEAEGQPGSSDRRPRQTVHSYEHIDPDTGKSTLQLWFDQLVLRSVVERCPVNTESLRPSELLQCIRGVMPEFSFKDHCDGVPFSLLIRNCNYLKAHGGFVHIMPIRAGEQKSPEDLHNIHPGMQEAFDRLHEDTVVGLRKYKLREIPSSDGVRTGPQPWKFSGRMLDF